MATLVLDDRIENRIRAERQDSGLDRYDEVWEGVYVMAPIANNEHQGIQARLAAVLTNVVGLDSDTRVLAGANVSDREKDWEHNYRVPDVLVVQPGGKARDCGTHLCGGPDFAVEIVSPRDRSREKLNFYSEIGVRELLVIDRGPWQLELYRLNGKRLDLIGTSHSGTFTTLKSEVVPVSFRLIASEPRPQIEVTHHDGKQCWLV